MQDVNDFNVQLEQIKPILKNHFEKIMTEMKQLGVPTFKLLKILLKSVARMNAETKSIDSVEDFLKIVNGRTNVLEGFNIDEEYNEIIDCYGRNNLMANLVVKYIDNIVLDEVKNTKISQEKKEAIEQLITSENRSISLGLVQIFGGELLPDDMLVTYSR